MFNRCKITVEDKDYCFLFDNNSLLEFCDLVGIDISQFGEYAETHRGTLSRDLFYTAAKVAELIDPHKDEDDKFKMTLFEFGNLMTKFTEKEWTALTKAFEASRPEKKKTKRTRKRASR